jgi:hypothetical protein
VTSVGSFRFGFESNSTSPEDEAMPVFRSMPCVAIALCGAFACHSPTKPLDGCVGDLPITLSSSRQSPVLTFDWTPRCGISQFAVSTLPGPGAAPVIVWSLSAPESAPIGPAITYGVTPRGATAQHAATPLVHGLTYRVSITRVVGGDGIAARGDEIFSY